MLTREQFDELRAKGLTVEQIVSFEQGQVPKKKQGMLKETGEDIKQTFGNLKNTVSETKGKLDKIGEANISGKQGYGRSFLQSAGTIAGGVSKSIGDVVTGGIKAVLPQKAEDKLKETVTDTVSAIAPVAIKIDEALGSPAGTFIENYKNLDDKRKRDVEALLGVSSMAFDIATAGTTKKVGELGIKKGAESVGRAAEKAGDSIKSGVKSVTDKLPSKESLEGVMQSGTELAERVPRTIERVSESIDNAKNRAQRINSSSPSVGNAIKSNLDERIINTVLEADDATIQAYKKVVEIAEDTPKNISMKKQPSIVSGDLVAEQFDIINKQRKKVGQELGEKVKELSKTKKVNMQSAFGELDDVLMNQGVRITYTKKGPKLDFSGTKYTPAERTRIQELYNLASEGGAELSPSSIHGKDQLFSKLQRESAMEGIGKIMVETPEGAQSLFGVFRDVFSKNLENVSPEIKELNKQYRQLMLVIEDIEDSILKTPNLNITKSADQAEFAKVNLRRIFGEAQSSPVYEAVADNMDALARELGYAGASPKQVAEFAVELRKLYPNSVPKAGFTGGISSGVSGVVKDILGQTLKLGTPDVKDQRKALIELLNSFK